MFKDLMHVQWICYLTLEQRGLEMCQARTWNKLYSEEIKKVDGVAWVALIGERSDYEIFKVIIKVVGTSVEVAEKFKRGYETLESYRNCDCSTQAGECIKHITKMKFEIPGLGIQAMEDAGLERRS